MKVFRIFVSTVLAVLMLGQTNLVLAATYNVPCNVTKLLKAITSANATSTDDTINLQTGCTYTLPSANNSTLGATGLPLIADAAIAGKLTINGNGATVARSTAKRTSNFRIMAVAIGGDLTLNNVTLRNGNLPTGGGGGIANEGSLTVSNSTIAGNSAGAGGGINGPGTLTVINSLFNGNTSVADGGGINSGGTLTVIHSTFSGNTAGIGSTTQGLGGGILVSEGIATVTDSTFSGNVANGLAGGGGILNGGCGCGSSALTVSGSIFTNNMANGGALFNTTAGTMTVTNSTISGNQGYSVGGISNAGTLTVTHTTITGNISQTDGGGIGNGGTLTVLNSTISGNSANGGGGGISNDGSLTVSNSTIAGNSADYGGGIASNGTMLTVIDSLFNGNTSVHDGAGINGDSITVIRSTFSGNTAGIANTTQGLGGGILVGTGISTVTDSTFSGNVAYGGAGGGGILNGGCGCGSSVLTVSGSTFTNNMANGGALFNTEAGTMTVTNSTISGNQGNYSVGGIFNAGTLTVTHSTITNNISQHDGGGGILNNGGVINLGSTIVAGNTSPSGPDIFGTICSLGYNLIGNTSGATITCDTTGNLIDEFALPLNLGPLQNNGGPTQTMALLTGSVAINAGDPAFAPPPDFDQRGAGFPRVVGGRIDIGAYESNP